MAKRKKPQGTKTPVQVDIVSDVVCPWCWLGYRLFKAAANQVKTPLELSWRPYMLDPTVPAEGMDYKAYMKNKFGDSPPDKFKAMRTMLEEKGPQYGIDFQFNKITKRPNTLNAHRVMRWAQNNADAGSETAEKLFNAFFTEGKDIGDIEVLTTIAENAGLDADITKDLLSSDKDANAVREEIMFFRNLGISGVPTFIYNGQFAIQGAQDPEAHTQAIQQAAQAGIPN